MISCAKTRQGPWQNNQRGTAPADRDGAAIAAAVTVHRSCATIFCSAAEIRGATEEDMREIWPNGERNGANVARLACSTEFLIIPKHRLGQDSRTPSRCRSPPTGHPSRRLPFSNSSTTCVNESGPSIKPISRNCPVSSVGLSPSILSKSTKAISHSENRRVLDQHRAGPALVHDAHG